MGEEPLAMDDGLLELFLRHVAEQCGFVILAYDDIEAALVEKGEARARRDAAGIPDFAGMRRADDRLWLGVQTLLGATANVSKLLWGSAAAPPIFDRQRLRDALGVPDDSPLRERTYATPSTTSTTDWKVGRRKPAVACSWTARWAILRRSSVATGTRRSLSAATTTLPVERGSGDGRPTSGTFVTLPRLCATKPIPQRKRR